ncbi:MAG TPA: hypothetical protein H9725_00905 [Candidatus Faecalibacterium gallistercoris]|uniref:Lipoprotein n=1 Tax=Candidatus Faecalibacterium gallistercoris TaxID=2838579 RepID=A0A9D2FDP8_9FIRM|nr:hypothetical protein [Candidatus Faecalibacterium gallistercoris]
MKLKKIASLMLAGVMAVSMLAGCSTTSVDPEPTPNPDPTPATGYSVEMASNLSDAAKKDYIAFEDNADDLTALEDALGNMSWTTTAGNTALPKVVTPVNGWNAVDTAVVVDDFVTALDIENKALTYGTMRNELVSFKDLNAAETVKYGLMYVIDGTVDVNKALKQVANGIEDLLEQLPNVNVSNTVTTRYTYDYTVSVSVANKALDVIDWYNGSANFIAVTVTRVPTAA